ncbi:MAG: NAD(P)H-binding protein [Bacteroidetes bacterium]|nr:NAD(P)H-binding protein [Bacteroidota bacterium]
MTTNLNSISILGCGWLGFPLGKKLQHEGFSVMGSITNQAKINTLREYGIAPVLIHLDNPETKALEVFLTSAVLIIAVPASRIHLPPLESLLKQAAETGSVKQVILVSSTGIYRNTRSEISESDTAAVDTNSNLFAVEQVVKSFDQLHPVILRMGGLVGYDRQPVNFAGSSKVRENPNGRINFIHRDDAVDILVQIIESGIQNETFNCCSDEHPTKKEFYSKLAGMAGIETPVFENVTEDSFKIISNKKVKMTLGFKFKELYKSLEA